MNDKSSFDAKSCGTLYLHIYQDDEGYIYDTLAKSTLELYFRKLSVNENADSLVTEQKVYSFSAAADTFLEAIDPQSSESSDQSSCDLSLDAPDLEIANTASTSSAPKMGQNKKQKQKRLRISTLPPESKFPLSHNKHLWSVRVPPLIPEDILAEEVQGRKKFLLVKYKVRNIALYGDSLDRECLPR